MHSPSRQTPVSQSEPALQSAVSAVVSVPTSSPLSIGPMSPSASPSTPPSDASVTDVSSVPPVPVSSLQPEGPANSRLNPNRQANHRKRCVLICRIPLVSAPKLSIAPILPQHHAQTNHSSRSSCTFVGLLQPLRFLRLRRVSYAVAIHKTCQSSPSVLLFTKRRLKIRRRAATPCDSSAIPETAEEEDSGGFSDTRHLIPEGVLEEPEQLYCPAPGGASCCETPGLDKENNPRRLRFGRTT